MYPLVISGVLYDILVNSPIFSLTLPVSSSSALANLSSSNNDAFTEILMSNSLSIGCSIYVS